jgi:hypothetical protein
VRALRISLAALGVIALAAAIVLRFVIVPGQAQFPDDVDSTRTYEGTLGLMLNAEALQSGDLANLFLTDVPITVDRHVTTEDVADGNALVHEDATVTTPAGVLLESPTDYAIDRKTMEAVDAFADAPNMMPREPGLVIGYPIGTEKQDYPGWSDEIGQVTTNTFVGEEEHAGLTTYKFHNVIDNQPITDPATLAMFPSEMPLATITQLLPALNVPEDTMAQFQQMAGQLPDPLPLTYLYSNDLTTWVEPTSGVIVDLERTETRSVAISVGPLTVPVADVFQWNYAQTPASVDDAVADAEDAMSTLSLYGTTLPLVLIGIGIIAIAAAFIVGRRRDGGATPTKTIDLSAEEKKRQVTG